MKLMTSSMSVAAIKKLWRSTEIRGGHWFMCIWAKKHFARSVWRSHRKLVARIFNSFTCCFADVSRSLAVIGDCVWCRQQVPMAIISGLFLIAPLSQSISIRSHRLWMYTNWWQSNSHDRIITICVGCCRLPSINLIQFVSVPAVSSSFFISPVDDLN